MLTGIYTGSAGYTLIGIDFDNIAPALFNSHIGSHTAACSYAFVTSYTIFISSYKSHKATS